MPSTAASKIFLLFFFLPIVLFHSICPINAQNNAPTTAIAEHNRIRRRIYNFYHHPAEQRPLLQQEKSAADSRRSDRKSSEANSKFILKCPRSSKNISSIVWSLNGHELFTVDFGENGHLEAKESATTASWLVEQKVWRSLEHHFGMILTAKRGRYKVEVETGGPRGQWIVLRINEPVPDEDHGEWKCQVYVRDLGGKLRLEAESRKRIEENSQEKGRPRKAREFSRSVTRKEGDAKSRWDFWESILEGRTFGFAKTDGEFAVFERIESGFVPLAGDSIEYTRDDSPSRILISGSEGKEEEDIGSNSPWRWRRARSGGSSTTQFSAKFANIALFILLSIVAITFLVQ